MTTQNVALLAALRRGPITPGDALRRFGSMRLAARVWELKQLGYPIERRMRELQNGKKVAEYFLKVKR